MPAGRRRNGWGELIATPEEPQRCGFFVGFGGQLGDAGNGFVGVTLTK